MKREVIQVLLVIATQATVVKPLCSQSSASQSARKEWQDFLVSQWSRPVHFRMSESQPAEAGTRVEDFENRVIDGSTAARGQFPWQVYIALGSSSGICGGSLISSHWTLTTAHCVSGFASFTLTVGVTSRVESQEGSITQTSRYWVMHSAYERTFIQNDIAIIKHQTPVSFNNFISPARLPRLSQLSQTFCGHDALVSGFGMSSNPTYSPTLQFAQVQIITNDECVITFPLHLLDSNICTAGGDGRTPCTGDSGGPLMVSEDDGEYTVVGIMSFGKKNCPARTPVAYVRITSYLRWIQATSGIAVEE